MNVDEMTSAMLDAAKSGDMDEALRLKAIIAATAVEPGYTDGIQINGWGDATGTLPDPDTIADRQLANAARRARKAVATAKKAGTLAAHVDAAVELNRIGYSRHAVAVMIRFKELAA